MIRAVALVAAFCAAQQAAALSCMVPEIAEDFARADASEDRYIVALGRIDFDPAALPGPMAGDSVGPEGVSVPARLSGQMLGRGGFDRPVETEITLRLNCIGPWCARIETGQRHIVFLKQDAAELTLDISPCPGMVYTDPTPEQQQTVEDCMAGSCG
ncbi:hypothetical protein [Thalassococcus profundi]|uniref:hypothetical protein n=1 Tax=Thalassococcus profundi TaxID=2282382 RepID=UPI001313E6DA|nr:hypothetical protein [Thalassococcus profundi]